MLEMPKSLIWLHFVVETSINKLLEAFGKFDESGIKLHPKAFLVPCILVLNLQKKSSTGICMDLAIETR